MRGIFYTTLKAIRNPWYSQGFSNAQKTPHSLDVSLTNGVLLKLASFVFFNEPFRSSAFSSALSRTSSFFSFTSFFALAAFFSASRSAEHTSELQSRFDLVCRLLLVN